MPLGFQNFVCKARSLAARGLRAKETNRGFWALGDQAIVSAGNFLTAIFMIGFLRQEDFARYGICFEVMCYLNSMQCSLVTYPLNVRGTSASEPWLRKLATACLIFTLLLAPISMLGMGLATHLLQRFQFAPTAILAILAWQAQETTRRALLCQFKYATALPGDLISYLGQALAVLILARRGELTLNTAFASMAISSASACILQSIQVGLAKVKIAELQTLAADFWSFGRWNMYSNVTTLFTDFSFNWVLAARCGLDASAAFQIAGNLLKPCNVVMIAIPGVAVPAAARARRTGGFEAAWKAMRHYLALGALVMIPYLMFLAVWPEGVMRVLYHHNAARYFPYANYARLNIVWLVALYFANSLGNFLAALEETRYQFISSFINILAVLAIGLPLTVFWGVPGAIAGWILCIVARGICNLIFLSRVKKQPDDLPDPVPMVSPAIAIGN